MPNEKKACQKRRGKSRFSRKSNNGIFSNDKDDDRENKSRRQSTKQTSWFEDPFCESSSEDDKVSVKHHSSDQLFRREKCMHFDHGI